MEGLIRRIAPQWALRRQVARVTMERLYKAASPSNARQTPTDWRSGDAVMDQARHKLRQWGRHLDENHDLTHSILDVLSYQVSQVTIAPRVLARSGAPAVDVNRALVKLWMDHRDKLDARGLSCWCVLSAQAARTWLRDGEVFAQHMMGARTEYPTGLPYLIELHEPDMLPFDELREAPGDGPRIVHGVEIRHGRPAAYHLYRRHPGEKYHGRSFSTETVRIPAEQITHLMTSDRIGQHRGVSKLAAAVTRLSDIADYEESERLAAKVASSLCAAITRGADFVNVGTPTDASSGERPMELQPGMIFDSLMPGERVEVLDTNRPNPGLSQFRKSMLQAATASVGVSYSTATHDYDGTYSSQRQQLVEVRQRYDQLREQYLAGFLRPMWRRFVQAAQLGSLLSVRGADPMTLFDFEAIPPPSPWIDPGKEASADETAIRAGIESRHGVIRKRGGDPERVDDELDADTMTQQAPESAPTDDPDMEDDEAPRLEVVNE